MRAWTVLVIVLAAGCVSGHAGSLRDEASKLGFPSGGRQLYLQANDASGNVSTAQVAYAYPKAVNGTDAFRQLEENLRLAGWNVTEEEVIMDNQGWMHASNSIRHSAVFGGCALKPWPDSNPNEQAIICELQQNFT